MSTLKVGARVKPSEYAIRPQRDYWLSRGRASEKSQAKQWLDDAIAKRGTVTELVDSKYCKQQPTVKWDDGSESRCLDYMIETV